MRTLLVLSFLSTSGLFTFALCQSQWTRTLAGHAYCVAFNPENPFSAYAGVSGGGIHRLFSSRDGGETWDSVWSAPNAIPVVAIHPLDSLLMFAGTLYASTQAVHGLWRTSNGGEQWSQVLDTVGFIGESVVFDRTAPNRVYAGCNLPGGFYASTDYGVTWTISPGTEATQFCTLALRPDSTNILYAGSFDGHIFKSSDRGLSWRTVLEGPGATEVPIIVINPKNPLIAYATHFGPPHGISKTADGGENWFMSGLDTVDMWSLDVDPQKPETLLAGEFDPGQLGRMFRSTNGGQTWTDFSSGLPSSGIAHWTVKIVSLDNPLVLAAMTGSVSGGIYKLEDIPVSVNGNDRLTPLTHNLMQNFPNPFNPQTTITFDLPEGAHVRLCVFDVLGREVAVLADEHRAAGEHAVQFEAQGLPSGVYFYRLELGSITRMRKMILVK